MREDSCPLREFHPKFSLLKGLLPSIICINALPVTAHPQCQPHLPQQKYYGSSAITDKGQRDPCIGNGIGDYCNVQDHLNCQMSHDPTAYQHSRQICSMHGIYLARPVLCVRRILWQVDARQGDVHGGRYGTQTETGVGRERLLFRHHFLVGGLHHHVRLHPVGRAQAPVFFAMLP